MGEIINLADLKLDLGIWKLDSLPIDLEYDNNTLAKLC